MRYDVWLGGKRLTDACSVARIVDVTEDAPKESPVTAALGVRDGSRLLRVRRERLTVEVTLALMEQDKARRALFYEQLCAWAAPGWLAISDRPGRRLHVDEARVPALGSVRDWTDEIKVSLTAYAVPYWDGSFPAMASITTAATSGNAALFPRGTATSCPVTAKIKAVGGTVNALTVTTGDTSMTFASLGLAAGSTLTIDHADDGTLRMKIGSTSVMSKRTAASADDLLLVPGKSGAVGFTANATCTAVFETRGRWR